MKLCKRKDEILLDIKELQPTPTGKAIMDGLIMSGEPLLMNAALELLFGEPGDITVELKIITKSGGFASSRRRRCRISRAKKVIKAVGSLPRVLDEKLTWFVENEEDLRS